MLKNVSKIYKVDFFAFETAGPLFYFWRVNGPLFYFRVLSGPLFYFWFLTREVTYLVLSEFSINLQMNYIWPPLNKNHSAKGQECRKKISIFFVNFFSKNFFEFFICCFSRSAWPQIDGIIKWCRIPGSLPSFSVSFPKIRRDMKNWIFRKIRNFGL